MTITAANPDTITADDLAELLADTMNDLSSEYANRGPESNGAFERDGVVYRVQKSQTGHFYAKTLVNGHFAYTSGAIYQVREIDRLDMNRALAISAAIGECVMCGRHLTASKSVMAGIGPVCIKKVAA